MLVFNERFNVLVSRYIAPTIEYSTSYTKLKKSALQELIAGKKVKNIAVDPSGKITFSFLKDDLLNALVNDIELFMIRVLLQQRAVARLHEPSADPSVNWNVVTDYYYSFFLAGLLLRLCYRGTFYFDDSTKNNLIKLIKGFTGQEVKLGSNYSFAICVDEENSEYSLTLATNGHHTHEIVWEQVALLLSHIKSLSTTNSDEYTILSRLDEIAQKQGATFPAQLRNALNYRPYYGVKEVERSYFVPNPTEFEDRWLDPIITFTHKVDDEQQKINLFAAYTKYLQLLSFNLLHEYFERRGRGNGILSAINKNRANKITLPSAQFKF